MPFIGDIVVGGHGAAALLEVVVLMVELHAEVGSRVVILVALRHLEGVNAVGHLLDGPVAAGRKVGVDDGVLDVGADGSRSTAASGVLVVRGDVGRVDVIESFLFLLAFIDDETHGLLAEYVLVVVHLALSEVTLLAHVPEIYGPSRSEFHELVLADDTCEVQVSELLPLVRRLVELAGALHGIQGGAAEIQSLEDVGTQLDVLRSLAVHADGLQLGASSEGLFANALDACVDIYRGEGGTALEGAWFDDGNLVVDAEFSEPGASTEGSLADGGDGRRQLYGGDLGASAEGASAYALHVLRNDDGGQSAASHESLVGDKSQTGEVA